MNQRLSPTTDITLMRNLSLDEKKRRDETGHVCMFPSTLLIDAFDGGYSSCTGHEARVYSQPFRSYRCCRPGPVHRTSSLVCWTPELRFAKPAIGAWQSCGPSRKSETILVRDKIHSAQPR